MGAARQQGVGEDGAIGGEQEAEDDCWGERGEVTEHGDYVCTRRRLGSCGVVQEMDQEQIVRRSSGAHQQVEERAVEARLERAMQRTQFGAEHRVWRVGERWIGRCGQEWGRRIGTGFEISTDTVEVTRRKQQTVVER